MVHGHHHKRKDSGSGQRTPTSPRSPSSPYEIETGPKPTWPSREKPEDPELSWFRFLFVLFEHPDACQMSKYVSAYVFLLIFVSSISSWIETIPKYQYPATYSEGITKPDTSLPRFQIINNFCMWNFLFEYCIRAVTVVGADVDPWKDIELFWDVKTRDGEFVTDEDNNVYQEYYHQEYNLGGIRMGSCTKFYCWATKPLSVVDFAAVLPFVLELLNLAKHLDGFISLRYLRLIRVFRVLKLQKQTIAVALFVNTIRKSAGPLGVLMFFVAMAVVVFGSVVYQVERGIYCPAALPTRQYSERGAYTGGSFAASADGSTGNVWVVKTELEPGLPYSEAKCEIVSGKFVDTCCDAAQLVNGQLVGDGCFCRMDFMGDSAEKTPYFSVFIAFWWVLTTITTVGYGDVYPTTLMGRFVGALAMCLGVVGFAMPIGIIGNAFEEEYTELSKDPRLLDEWLMGEDNSGEDKEKAKKEKKKKEQANGGGEDKNKPEEVSISIYNPKNRAVLRQSQKTSKDVMTVLNEVAIKMGVTKKEWESFNFKSPRSGTESAV